MFTVFKEYAFSSAHAVRGHTRGCQNLHGHNYRVRVLVSSETLDALGMVIDFADLKAIVERVVGRWDHAVINDFPPFDAAVNPTAEELARHVFDEVAKLLPEGRLVRRVEIWETDASCASYER